MRGVRDNLGRIADAMKDVPPGIIQFDEPWAVQLLNEHTSKATDEVCPLLAVAGERALVVRQGEMFWWPLRLIRVIEELNATPPEEPGEPQEPPTDEAHI